ncbi:MAG: Stp1/IreP family PP2C-type Ser/Thr phosphatase [Oscillospiraceae bacterium]
MKISGKTDIGNQRSENQDNYRAGREQDDTVWALVCDGMGGARGGKLASSIAASQIERVFSGQMSAKLSSLDLRTLMTQAIAGANTLIYNASLKDIAMLGMGTTAVCAAVQNGYLHYVNVGDSRIYLYRNHAFTQLSRDHSMVQELVEQGSITEQEAYVHPHKNLITRALGVAETVQADYGECAVKNGDLILLCSDGLTNYVSTEDIIDIIETAPFFNCAEMLIDKALANNGQDNITAVLVQVEETDASANGGNNG